MRAVRDEWELPEDARMLRLALLVMTPKRLYGLIDATLKVLAQ